MDSSDTLVLEVSVKPPFTFTRKAFRVG